jgi:hypothetical protein
MESNAEMTSLYMTSAQTAKSRGSRINKDISDDLRSQMSAVSAVTKSTSTKKSAQVKKKCLAALNTNHMAQTKSMTQKIVKNELG